jgi:phage terminase large subunit GpA-like protein
VHLPTDASEDLVKQLTSESLISRTERGRVRREWRVMEGRRNEVLDCANYARGLAAMRGWDRWREPIFVELETLLGIAAVTTPEAAPKSNAAPSSGGTQQRPWLGHRGNWLRR